MNRLALGLQGFGMIILVTGIEAVLVRTVIWLLADNPTTFTVGASIFCAGLAIFVFGYFLEALDKSKKEVEKNKKGAK